jgi:hypothetical protein
MKYAREIGRREACDEINVDRFGVVSVDQSPTTLMRGRERIKGVDGWVDGWGIRTDNSQ